MPHSGHSLRKMVVRRRRPFAFTNVPRLRQMYSGGTSHRHAPHSQISSSGNQLTLLPAPLRGICPKGIVGILEARQPQNRPIRRQER
jgi:hypothetical protein